MKKYLTAAALIGLVGFAGISMANPRGNYGYGNCGGPAYCDNWSYSEKDGEKASAFFEETKELRKQIVVKRSELDALMLQDNPDEKKVAGLTGELYDLRTQMHEKAGKTFEDKAGYGYGPGYGNCGGGRRSW
jgi:zinc resistance-associated protein